MTIRGYLQRRWIRSWLALIVLGARLGGTDVLLYWRRILLASVCFKCRPGY
jgi:hypothetical protein